MDRSVVAVTDCMGTASVIAYVSSSDIILRASATTEWLAVARRMPRAKRASIPA